MVVGGGLPCDLIVPAQDAGAQILAQTHTEHLHAAAMLRGQEVGPEVQMILHVVDLHLGPRAGTGKVDRSAKCDTALLAEVVAPHKVV